MCGDNLDQKPFGHPGLGSSDLASCGMSEKFVLVVREYASRHYDNACAKGFVEEDFFIWEIGS